MGDYTGPSRGCLGYLPKHSAGRKEAPQREARSEPLYMSEDTNFDLA